MEGVSIKLAMMAFPQKKKKKKTSQKLHRFSVGFSPIISYRRPLNCTS
jgi:hypothetical protein